MKTLEVYLGRDYNWYWRLVQGGETIATGNQGWITKTSAAAEALKAREAMKTDPPVKDSAGTIVHR